MWTYWYESKENQQSAFPPGSYVFIGVILSCYSADQLSNYPHGTYHRMRWNGDMELPLFNAYHDAEWQHWVDRNNAVGGPIQWLDPFDWSWILRIFDFIQRTCPTALAESTRALVAINNIAGADDYPRPSFYEEVPPLDFSDEVRAPKAMDTANFRKIIKRVDFNWPRFHRLFQPVWPIMPF